MNDCAPPSKHMKKLKIGTNQKSLDKIFSRSQICENDPSSNHSTKIFLGTLICSNNHHPLMACEQFFKNTLPVCFDCLVKAVLRKNY